MGDLEPKQDADCQLRCLAPRERAAVVELFSQGSAEELLGDEERPARVGQTEIQDLDDVRVTQPTQRAALCQEPLGQLVVCAGIHGLDDLHHALLAQRAMLDHMHLPHPTLYERSHMSVGAALQIFVDADGHAIPSPQLSGRPGQPAHAKTILPRSPAHRRPGDAASRRALLVLGHAVAEW